MSRFPISRAMWVAGVVALGAKGVIAATVNDANLFQGAGVSGITITASAGFSSSAFVSSNLVDGTNKAYVYNASTSELVSITGFNSGIDTLRFFDTPSYTGRTAPSVKIYYSSTVQSSLVAGNYTQLTGPGTGGAFTIPVQAGNSSFYSTDTSPVDHPNAGDPSVVTSATIHYSSLTGLNIPTGTRSVLLDFSRTSAFGDGLTEIQAFVPEPAGVSLLAIGAVTALARRRQRRPA